MTKEKMETHYDEKSDVMYVSFGVPVPSYSEELEEGVYLRYSLETDEISGITILDFSTKKDSIKKISAQAKISLDCLVHGGTGGQV